MAAGRNTCQIEPPGGKWMTVQMQQFTPPASTQQRNENAPAGIPRTDGAAPIVCPVCHGENSPDAVFCSNTACHKALGEWKYVLEELKEEARWHETLAEKATAFIGKPHFILAHVAWFAVWALLNSGIFAFVRRFDEFPYVLLGILLAAEAIFLTGFILISGNRQQAHADKRAELDYEVSVKTYRQIAALDGALARLTERLDQLETPAALNGRHS
jgi:uncharacterized membrane protein